ncbi:mannose-1-phosphate guanylyltransferase [Porphyromonas gingivicanis]|uniref:mannose-1-phosphate guanylyltransferase n=1 Tax=Porphyromonas gingivicanis TaxID=266762 RepID=A0A0A2GBZ1_9PORP|nr:mannose-1-phosphate guanylyltransferase [Porphyromonas gingivicanis]KGN97964.1 mannose-1-phosphate guanylyltransferase [Porphyromonas gingivicanis]
MANKFFCIIMGGGIGSRFWPVSRKDKPKQFLDFFGTGQTLLQQTYQRVTSFVPKENVYVVTNEVYIEETLHQLPDLTQEQILAEPMRRNTAPCIAYALHRIRSRCADASVFVTPSDHVILNNARFKELALKSLQYVQGHDSLVTLGIMPHRAETGYGYIQMDSENQEDDFIKVKLFTEKPNIEMAEIFVKSGDFLWNSGMFAWNMQTILSAFEMHAPEIAEIFAAGEKVYGTEQEKEFIQENFPNCPNISIDYAIMEKANNVRVLPGDFGWADLGTWGAIHELAEKDTEGNAALNTRCIFSKASNNVVSLSNKDRIVVVHGVSNCIIAEHDNVLMVCDKDDEQRVKALMTSAQLQFGEEYI